jgi:hypothetical protein
MCIFLGLLSAPLRLLVPTPPTFEEAGAVASQLLAGRAPNLALVGIHSAHTSSQPESLSSATPSVRLGHEAPHENESSAHGAD